ncbi:response regulator containing a CheY-like receiver domain and an HTH DNA-binding domain [Desulfosporosinus orientis DSM 765]|uniref:Stage 0 sporulation protein A homolog n=1 Tax=Desulfosporosinus orientis (strain ATCC 19365 / DSM 765 / NCIMB 8382 / VKM B-1628 / Singapore I) TaxID=768706 RepID=G7WFX3_DESOD|nr:response regulator transcription factor [Desulfosporosinus orientis]AET69488.1 response regulator containing a CheY-like receiver domain and an HTH DNA-binding domain [Desulfosporosinus orientis DSM 765]
MSIKVFLADDHKILRESLIILLQQEKDIEVVGEAADGQQAIQEILRLKPDIAILDISLPRLNGLEVAARLKKEDPALKLIILTMHKNEDFVARAYQLEVNGYVLKENALEELLKSIRIVQAGGIYLSTDITSTVVAGFVANFSQKEKKPELISSREREILQLLAEGNSNKDIAQMLSLSLKTVETHRSNIMHKLGFKNITDLVLYAVRNHIIEP